ncbi:MFS transporter [Rickettsia endosymbiont of Gonocerus acuteangulatus]|uniref:MFS transporter n=1 Tax=Rickettsia endosymbiont of Gonocerus acuteangulatus TaxID=3066266 RepID=UPI003132A57C
MPSSAFLIAFFVSIIRYYDYALFGLSAHILAQNFLPRSTHEIQLLGFFALLSAAVVIRPLGSIIFGYIGDRYGRTKSIKISMFISSISTLLIAVTPSFDKIGILATIMLTFCRMIFIASLAGEVDGIKVYVAEKTKNNQKNLGLGVVASCTQIGALLAAMAYYCATNLNIYYLWRINFLIGAIFGLFAILMRNYFKESNEFLHHKNKQSNNISIFQVLKNSKKSFILALLINGTIGGIYHFLVYFLGVFLARIAFINPIETEFMNISLIITYGIAAIFAGMLADKINPLKQIIFALLLSLVAAFAMQILLYQQIFTVLGPIMLIGLAAFYAVPLQIIVQSLFKTAIRMRLYSLSHSLGGIILSSSTPFFSMLLWQNFKSLWVTFSFFTFLLIILTIAVLVLRKTITR